MKTNDYKLCPSCEDEKDIKQFRERKRKYKNSIYVYLNHICKSCEKIYLLKYIK